MSQPKVYIIIVNYNQWQDTRHCLESVLRSTYNNFTVFIIDNDSGNNSLEHLSEWLKEVNMKGLFQNEPADHILLKKEQLNSVTGLSALPKVVFIQNDENRGFAAGNNVILQHLKDEDAWFWLLNPDMVIKENTLAELALYASKLPSESIIGTVVRSWSGNHELLFYGGHKINFLSATVSMVKKEESVHKLDYISGGCLFTHTSNLEKLGLLPERYFLYWEETDWCYTAKRSGYTLAVCPDAVCFDKISSVIGKSFTADYYYVRNGLLFISKFRKKNIPFVLFFMSIRFMKRVITGKWARAKGVFKGTLDFFKMKTHDGK